MERNLGMISPDQIKPEERLQRMRESFNEDLSILAEDYEHFTGISPQDVPKPPNTDSHKSGELTWPQDPARN
jgi:hypothetical protein